MLSGVEALCENYCHTESKQPDKNFSVMLSEVEALCENLLSYGVKAA